MQLTSQGDHGWAVKCFDVLLDLIGHMEKGEEIVFADEMGSWMIPIDDKDWIAAYMISLAATAEPAEFAAKAIPVISRDSGQSFTGKAYASARKVANKEQLGELEAQVRAKGSDTVRQPRTWRRWEFRTPATRSRNSRVGEAGSRGNVRCGTSVSFGGVPTKGYLKRDRCAQRRAPLGS